MGSSLDFALADILGKIADDRGTTRKGIGKKLAGVGQWFAGLSAPQQGQPIQPKGPPLWMLGQPQSQPNMVDAPPPVGVTSGGSAYEPGGLMPGSGNQGMTASMPDTSEGDALASLDRNISAVNQGGASSQAGPDFSQIDRLIGSIQGQPQQGGKGDWYDQWKLGARKDRFENIRGLGRSYLAGQAPFDPNAARAYESVMSNLHHDQQLQLQQEQEARLNRQRDLSNVISLVGTKAKMASAAEKAKDDELVQVDIGANRTMTMTRKDAAKYAIEQAKAAAKHVADPLARRKLEAQIEKMEAQTDAIKKGKTMSGTTLSPNTVFRHKAKLYEDNAEGLISDEKLAEVLAKLGIEDDGGGNDAAFNSIKAEIGKLRGARK